jgi:hypothetical protein
MSPKLKKMNITIGSVMKKYSGIGYPVGGKKNPISTSPHL